MMQLTKFTHACFTVTKNGDTLVVDPGNWSTDLAGLANVTAIVITHEHPDHYDHTQLQTIAQQFPQAVVYAHASITATITELPTQSVGAGDTVNSGEFTLRFYGGDHAVIHPSFTPVANLGVLVNNAVYYGGDSFVQPDVPVKVLALPAAAPWMKISEAMDYCMAVNASQTAFPTHDAILSSTGKALTDKLLGGVSPVYQRLTQPLIIED